MFHFPFPSFQEGVLCSPEGRECIEEAEATSTRGCGKPCEGIYADVDKLDEDIESNDYDSLIAKYREYKRLFVKNIGFNGSNYETAFGKLNSLMKIDKLTIHNTAPSQGMSCKSLG